MHSVSRDKYESKGVSISSAETLSSPTQKRKFNFSFSCCCTSSSTVAPQGTNSTHPIEIHYDIRTHQVTSISERSLSFMGPPPPDLKIYHVVQAAASESRLVTLKNGEIFLSLTSRGNPYNVEVITQHGDAIPALAFYEKRQRGKIGFLKILPNIQLLFSTYAPLRGSKLAFLYVNEEGKIVNIDRRFLTILGHKEREIDLTNIFLQDFVFPSDHAMLNHFLHERKMKNYELIANLPIKFMTKDGGYIHAILSQTSISPKEMCISFLPPNISSTPTIDSRAEHLISNAAALTAAFFEEHYRGCRDSDELSSRGAGLKELEQELTAAARLYTTRQPILEKEIAGDRLFSLEELFEDIQSSLALFSASNTTVVNIKDASTIPSIQGSRVLLRQIIGSLIFKHFQSISPQGTLCINVSCSTIEENAVQISIRSPVTTTSLLSPSFIEAFQREFPPITHDSIDYVIREKMRGYLLTGEISHESTELESIFSFSTDWSRRSSSHHSDDFCMSNSPTFKMDRVAGSFDEESSLSEKLIPPSPVKQTVETPVFKPRHILYAEDALTIGRITRKSLEELGHRVTYAKNGKEAIDFLRNQDLNDPFTLGIFDIQMPEFNGDQVALEAKRMGLKFPIVAVTGNSSIDEQIEYAKCGIRATYAKPVSKEQYMEIIANHPYNPIIVEDFDSDLNDR